MFMLCS